MASLPDTPVRPFEIAAFWHFGFVPVTRMEMLFEKLLVEGLGGENVAVAAFGLPGKFYDADPLVKSAFTEFGIDPKLTTQQLSWLALYSSIENVITKKWDAYQGVDLILEITKKNITALYKTPDPYFPKLKDRAGYFENKFYQHELWRVTEITGAYFSKEDYFGEIDRPSEEEETRITKARILEASEVTFARHFSKEAELPEKYAVLREYIY